MFGNSKIALSYCGDIVRRSDPDRFLMTLLMPPDVREDLWALFAFNHEIARTREIVTEPTLGLIRLQWWSDEIDTFYRTGRCAAHEVLEALTRAIKKHHIPAVAFEILINARRLDIEGLDITDYGTFAAYAEATSVPLLRAAARITGGDEAEACLQPLGRIYALTGLLRAVSFHARAGRCLLPADMLAAHSLTREEIIAGRADRQILAHIIHHLAGRAQEDLTIDVKAQGRFAKACRALTALRLGHLVRHGYEPAMADPAFLVPRFLITYWKS